MRQPLACRQLIDPFRHSRGKSQLQRSAFRAGDVVYGQFFVQQGKRMPMECQREAWKTVELEYSFLLAVTYVRGFK